ncbi:MAG TPA: hypothetical protein VHH52_05615 [Pseudonocardiaceae bacterium]|nr:hypothetical protein [Pseudonocardiaceae bacterium]
MVFSGAGAVDADEVLGLAVIRFELVIADRPVAGLPHNVACRVVVQIRPTVIERGEPEVIRCEPQRDAAVELRATADHLGRVPLDRGPIQAVLALIDVRFVVEVRLDVAGVEAVTEVGHPGDRDALLRPGGERLVTFEVAYPIRRLILGAQQRPFLQEEHLAPGTDQH